MDKIMHKKKHISLYATHFVFLLFLTILLHASFTDAHMEGGIDVETGNYTIDIGYNTETIKTMQPTVFLIAISKNILNKSNNNNDKDESLGVELDSWLHSKNLWIRIDNPEKKTIITMTLFPEQTGTYLFTATFPEKGNYTMKMKFIVQSESSIPLIVENTAVLNVVAEKTISTKKVNHNIDLKTKLLKTELLISFIIGCIIGMILLIIIKEIYNQKNKKVGDP